MTAYDPLENKKMCRTKGWEKGGTKETHLSIFVLGFKSSLIYQCNKK